jgi:hypothetical protein
MAAQLIRMKGFSRRELPSWRAVATSSLPVPLSPVISTVDGVSATLSMIFRTSCIADDSPTSAGFPPSPRALRRAVSWVRIAFARTLESSLWSKGL